MGAGCGRRAVLVYSNSREYFKQQLWIAAAVTGYEAAELPVGEKAVGYLLELLHCTTTSTASTS